MPAPASEETKQEWKNLIEQQRQSKLPIKQWCQQHELSADVFRYWRDKLFPADLTKSNFTQLMSKRSNILSLQALVITHILDNILLLTLTRRKYDRY